MTELIGSATLSMFRPHAVTLQTVLKSWLLAIKWYIALVIIMMMIIVANTAQYKNVPINFYSVM